MVRTAGSIGDETATAVRDAARRLFARHGYAAVSMRTLAAEVGVQAGALYNHFPNKQAILVDLLRAHMDDLLASAKRALRPRGDPAERLRAFTRFHIRHHLPRADAVFISYMELRSLEAETFDDVATLRQRYEKILLDILDDGMKTKAFSAGDARVAAMAIIAMLNGMTTWFREDGRLSLEEIEDLYVGMVDRCVGAAPKGEPA